MWLLSSQMNNSSPFIKAKFYWFLEEKALSAFQKYWTLVRSHCPVLK
jgi:hypothetical protein